MTEIINAFNVLFNQYCYHTLYYNYIFGTPHYLQLKPEDNVLISKLQDLHCSIHSTLIQILKVHL